jgi:hypothetical protein
MERVQREALVRKISSPDELASTDDELVRHPLVGTTQPCDTADAPACSIEIRLT